MAIEKTGAAGVSATAIEHSQDVQDAPINTAPQTAPAPSVGNHVEQYSGADEATAYIAQRKAALANGASAESKSAQAELKGAFEGPIAELRQKFPNPEDAIDGHFQDLVMLNRPLQRSEFADAMKHVNAPQACMFLYDQFAKAYPNATPEQLNKLTGHTMEFVHASAAQQTKLELRDTAAGMIRDGARTFLETAKNATKLDAIVEELKSASPEKAEVLRASVGLEHDAKVTPENVAKAMTARAQLMNKEATEIANGGELTLATKLLSHDVAEVYRRKAGIESGSLADEGIHAVRGQGEAAKREFEHAMLGTAIVASPAIMALGFGAAASVALSAVAKTPELALAYQEIDSAKAGESGGTMRAGAGERAKEGFLEKVAISALEVAAEFGAEKALHGIAHHVASEGLSNTIKYLGSAVSGGGIKAAAQKLEEELH